MPRRARKIIARRKRSPPAGRCFYGNGGGSKKRPREGDEEGAAASSSAAKRAEGGRERRIDDLIRSVASSDIRSGWIFTDFSPLGREVVFTTGSFPPPLYLTELPPGLVIDGRYRIISKLGEGGFGVIYDVVDGTDAQVKVMKIFTRNLLDRTWGMRTYREEQIHRLYNEIFGPRDSVILFDNFVLRGRGGGWLDLVYRNDRFAVIIMEKMTGDVWKGLPGYRTSAGRSEKDFLRFFKFVADSISAVCRQLSTLHSHRIYHVDMKANNILYRELTDTEWKIVISDFSISCINIPGSKFDCLEVTQGVSPGRPPSQPRDDADMVELDTQLAATTFQSLIIPDEIRGVLGKYAGLPGAVSSPSFPREIGGLIDEIDALCERRLIGTLPGEDFLARVYSISGRLSELCARRIERLTSTRSRLPTSSAGLPITRAPPAGHRAPAASPPRGLIRPIARRPPAPGLPAPPASRPPFAFGAPPSRISPRSPPPQPPPPAPAVHRASPVRPPVVHRAPAARASPPSRPPQPAYVSVRSPIVYRPPPTFRP